MNKMSHPNLVTLIKQKITQQESRIMLNSNDYKFIKYLLDFEIELFNAIEYKASLLMINKLYDCFDITELTAFVIELITNYANFHNSNNINIKHIVCFIMSVVIDERIFDVKPNEIDTSKRLVEVTLNLLLDKKKKNNSCCIIS